METTEIKPKEGKRKILVFLLCLILSCGLCLIVREPGFTASQTYVLFILFFSIALWFTEVIPPFAVGLLIISFLVFSLGNRHFNPHPEKIDLYVTTFSSSIIWLLLGGFFIAVAMTKTGLDKDLLQLTIRISGTKPRSLLIGLMSTTMLASMLMSNTATTAMVIASVMPLLKKLGKESGLTKAILLGVSISAVTGGLGTIIGTPPNALAAGALEQAGIKMDFLTWIIYGMPVALVLTAVTCLVLILLFVKDNKPLNLSFLNEEKQIQNPQQTIQKRIVISVLIVTVLMWLTGSIHGITVAAVSAIPLVLLTLTKVLDGGDVRAMPWDTLLLVAGGLSLGLALQHTGLMDHYALKISNLHMSSTVILIVFGFATMLFSNIMSNTATSTVLIPLGMAILPAMKTEICMVIGMAASTALFLPVSTPPNAIAYSTGLIEQKDFRVGGLLIGLLGPSLIILWVLLIS
ncbi:MAG TPA: DASS family sodium-coupled anion symporter [Bacteroidia bacterium]|nr:DASS family sodium-coupled anion symporter [Bacteroidia bacterium]